MARGRSRQRHPGTERDTGTATAEFAVVLPAVVLLVVLLTGAAAVGFSQLRAFDAARSAAREIARGEPRAAILAEAKKHAGDSARVTVRADGGYSVVTVTIALPEAIFFLDEVDANATARYEGDRGGAS